MFSKERIIVDLKKNHRRLTKKCFFYIFNNEYFLQSVIFIDFFENKCPKKKHSS